MAISSPLRRGRRWAMHAGQFIFAQLMEFLPRHEFNQCVRRYRGNSRTRGFSCFDQFFCMAFAQLTYRESLRDIETCLRAMGPKLYHAGFRGRIARSTLADANEHRDWHIYADFAHVLIAVAKRLYANDGFAVDLDAAAYAFDSTTIDLCLALFPWARFRRRKGAVKLHTLIDLRGNIPCFIRISDGKMHDVRALDDLLLEPGAFYMMDRGYIDFARLYVFTQQSAFFVIRSKRNMDYSRQPYQAVDKLTGLRSDQKITLQGVKTSRQYPEALRRITYRDAETQKRFAFLTNNWTLPALTIAQLYKCRWQVELFFKWIKQHLRIKAFYGTSRNAVKTQVWIAITVYVLVAIVKKELKLERSLYEILQILSVALFEKTSIFEALSSKNYTNQNLASPNQLSLFDL
jgi:hypothetical protein